MQFAPAAAVLPSKIRAIAALAEHHPGTLRLFYGEDSLPTPDFIRDAGCRAITEGHTFYTPNAGTMPLRQAIAAQTARLHGVTLDPAREIVVTASGMVALVLACQATVGPGDSAVILTPLWPNVAAAVRVAGAEAIEVPLALGAAGFELDLEQIEAAIQPTTLACWHSPVPATPTAWTATADNWSQLVAICQRHDLWLVADGVYERIVYDGSTVAPNPLRVPGARERTIIIQSFSKSYRMTGWRVGYALAPPDLARAMTNLQEFVVSNAPSIGQEAARVAILEGEPFIAASQQRYARHRRIAVDRLRQMAGVIVPEPTGAFYVFPRLDGLTDSFDLCRHLVESHGVGLAPGAAFGVGGEGHIRICFAVDESILVDALDRFEAGWLDYSRS